MAENWNPGALAGATGAASRSAKEPDAAHLAYRQHSRQIPAQTCGHETADAWGAIVAIPSHGWRIIVCRDGLQWILQRRKNGGAERPWRAVGYCRTREALMRLCATSCGPLAANVAAILASLPEVIGKGGAA